MIPYFDGFADKQDIADQFCVTLADDINIVAAYYSYEDYSGYSCVVFEQGGVLYEVNGSHCSCFGLEGQWEPEVVVLEELVNRPGYGYGFDDDFRAALRTFA